MPKGLLVMSHHMEDVEALATRALLKRAGFDIVTATFEHTKLITTAYDAQVYCDHYMREVPLKDIDFLIIPGGPYVKKTIETNDDMVELIQYFHKNERLIAAICAGPRFLLKAGVLEGHSFTAFPGSLTETEKNAGFNAEAVHQDGLFITSKAAGTVYPFVAKIITHFQGENAANDLLTSIYHPNES